MTENLAPGTIFAGYQIERLLGRGGMGAVYAAQHPRLPRRDALKLLAEDIAADDEFRARFFREADLAGRLDHPNIVIVHDRGVDRETPWIAMQFIDGTDAAALIRTSSGGLPPAHALHIITEAARGIDAAHRAGLLHRDIKPANILLESRPGEPDRVLVTDFGIARAVGETALTRTGSVLGTIAYAAPEQLSADTMDHRVDIYALGCTLYELLTGAKPFPYPTAGEVVRAHLLDAPPRPTALRPDLPPAIDDVIATALAKHPDYRYPTCGSLAAAAADALGFPTPRADRTSPPEQSWTPPGSTGPQPSARRSKRLLTAAVLVSVALLATAGVLFLRNSGGTSGRPITSSAAAPTTTAPPWGSYAYMAEAFPSLLPSAPAASGYQGIRCVAADSAGRQVGVNEPAAALNQLNCNGNREPVDFMGVICNASRVPVSTFGANPGGVVVGDERWERASGTGRIIWTDVTNSAKQPSGTLTIYFDDVSRNFCTLTIFGGTSGQDLHDRWWPTTPL